MQFWYYYFNRQSHVQFHDFTTTIHLPKNIRRILGLGLKFIPTPRWTQSGTAPEFNTKTLKRFERDLTLKGHFGPGPIASDEPYNPHLCNKSTWTPPPPGKSSMLSNIGIQHSPGKLNLYSGKITAAPTCSRFNVERLRHSNTTPT
jgi:hypothetical protein